MSKKSEKGPVVVSVINLKGGVGKTTIAALLARHGEYGSLRVPTSHVVPTQMEKKNESLCDLSGNCDFYPGFLTQ